MVTDNINLIDETRLEKSKHQDKLSEIDLDETVFIKKETDKLQGWIDILPDREPTKVGNITMKTHLSNCKKNIEDDPDKFIINCKVKLNMLIEQKEQKISKELQLQQK